MNRVIIRSVVAVALCYGVAAPLASPFAVAEPNAAQPELPKREAGHRHVKDGVQPRRSASRWRLPRGQQTTVGLMFRPSVPADGGMLFDVGAGARDSTDVDAQHGGVA